MAKKHTSSNSSGGTFWLYGYHAVEAALANPDRTVRRIIASPANRDKIKLPRTLPTPEILEPRAIDQMLGSDAVHQGIAALVAPLDTYQLEDVIHLPMGPLLILDQISDPHNVGAIMRSAAAFGAVAVIAPKDNSAPETAVMAKAASGALDCVKRISVTNLASSMRELQDAGWWIIGLAGDTKRNLNDITIGAKTVLVLGAEGRGMRRLTAESCDELAKLPMEPAMESLNVSNAAAIALYHCYVARLTSSRMVG